jgi:hypothetical protein
MNLYKKTPTELRFQEEARQACWEKSRTKPAENQV